MESTEVHIDATPSAEKVGREKTAIAAKAKDGKTVATALFLLPAEPGETAPAGVLTRLLESAVAKCASYIESSVFPAEIRRYEEIPGEGKRRNYAPLHLYLSFEITASNTGETADENSLPGAGMGLSSCLGELFVYRGELLTDYRVFSLTADERAQIFLSPGTLRGLLSGKKRKKAEKGAPFDSVYLKGDTLIACRPLTELLPLRCHRRNAREKLLEQRELGKIREYRSISPDKPLITKREKKKGEKNFGKRAKRSKKPLDKLAEL